MGTSSENAGLLDVPEKVLWVGEHGSGAQPSQDLIKDHPSLLRASSLNTSLHTRREKSSNEDLSPLLHENADLKAEQSSLLLRNSELLSRTLLLKLENQRLKEQLESQLRKMHITTSSSVSSSGSLSSSEEDSSDWDNEEFVLRALETGVSEVKLASAGDDYTHSK